MTSLTGGQISLSIFGLSANSSTGSIGSGFPGGPIARAFGCEAPVKPGDSVHGRQPISFAARGAATDPH